MPGLYLWGFFTPPVDGALFRAALVANCLRGALPPVDFRAVCLVRAIVESIYHLHYGIVLFPNRVLRYEANYICTIILQRLRTESRFSGGGASQSAISLRNQRWLIGLLMIFGSFTSSVNNCQKVSSVECLVSEPRGSVRPHTRMPSRSGAAKAACWSTRDREPKHVIKMRYLLLLVFGKLLVHNLLFVFVCKKVAKLISIWLKKIWP